MTIFFLLLILTYTNGLTIRLLHRSSLPAYQNENFQSFLMNNVDKYMMNKFNPKLPLVHADNNLFFVNIAIGEPPVQQYLAIDTGSSVVWVRGFTKYDQKFVYNPNHSTTFTRLNCDSYECSLSLKFGCSSANRDWCQFQIVYGDNIRRSVGYMGLETFAFKSSYPETPDDILYNVLFGVSIYSRGGFYQDANFNGVLALGPLQTSVLRNFPKKFSYCIGNIHDPDSSSYLNLGGVNIDALGTDLLHNDTPFYKADMECINVEETCLNIKPEVLTYDENDPYTGVTFDTGSVVSYLADEAYDVVADKVVALMSLRGYDEPLDKDTQLCYLGQMEQLSDFPPFLFVFNQYYDLNIRLDKESLFYDKSWGMFCITIIKSSFKNDLYKNLTIIGLMAQQYHQIGFDLENSLLSISYSPSCILPV